MFNAFVALLVLSQLPSRCQYTCHGFSARLSDSREASHNILCLPCYLKMLKMKHFEYSLDDLGPHFHKFSVMAVLIIAEMFFMMFFVFNAL